MSSMASVEDVGDGWLWLSFYSCLSYLSTDICHRCFNVTDTVVTDVSSDVFSDET